MILRAAQCEPKGGGRQRKTSKLAATLRTQHGMKVETFLHLLQLSERSHFRRSGFRYAARRGEDNRRVPPLCMPEKIIELCVYVGERVGEGKIGQPGRLSTQIQYLSHLQSTINLVLIAS